MSLPKHYFCFLLVPSFLLSKATILNHILAATSYASFQSEDADCRTCGCQVR